MPALTPISAPGSLLAESKLLAVLVIDDLDAAVPVASALLAGGVNAMELTLRTPVALEAARLIKEQVPQMMVGIGTILTTDQVDEAITVGATFGVSPGINPEVMRHAASVGLPFGPGVMTPTDIDIAIREGARLLKFFPAGSSGGLAHLKNIAAPFSHLGVQFIPLGGVTLDNMTDYLKSDLIAAVGGSWLAPRDVIARNDWKTIEENARVARGRLN
ncbi:MAG: bifunctional 4-hydroxy-2-oxoglutarate aldolase/2-dehydro-3-deoxy-phosphogluconate aldolase [Verrucomicrobiales bacterium]|nr:bifunctional 4-hydroxy-2-oxoglutarate aldolase/2-dehydro-3-deoxy-phosphogluconate aldolase [Verrucomicrobiales bacterium]